MVVVVVVVEVGLDGMTDLAYGAVVLIVMVEVGAVGVVEGMVTMVNESVVVTVEVGAVVVVEGMVTVVNESVVVVVDGAVVIVEGMVTVVNEAVAVVVGGGIGDDILGVAVEGAEVRSGGATVVVVVVVAVVVAGANVTGHVDIPFAHTCIVGSQRFENGTHVPRHSCPSNVASTQVQSVAQIVWPVTELHNLLQSITSLLWLSLLLLSVTVFSQDLARQKIDASALAASCPNTPTDASDERNIHAVRDTAMIGDDDAFMVVMMFARRSVRT